MKPPPCQVAGAWCLYVSLYVVANGSGRAEEPQEDPFTIRGLAYILMQGSLIDCQEKIQGLVIKLIFATLTYALNPCRPSLGIATPSSSALVNPYPKQFQRVPPGQSSPTLFSKLENQNAYKKN